MQQPREKQNSQRGRQAIVVGGRGKLPKPTCLCVKKVLHFLWNHEWTVNSHIFFLNLSSITLVHTQSLLLPDLLNEEVTYIEAVW